MKIICPKCKKEFKGGHMLSSLVKQWPKFVEHYRENHGYFHMNGVTGKCYTDLNEHEELIVSIVE
jgi:hypothetical protein